MHHEQVQAQMHQMQSSTHSSSYQQQDITNRIKYPIILQKAIMPLREKGPILTPDMEERGK